MVSASKFIPLCYQRVEKWYWYIELPLIYHSVFKNQYGNTRLTVCTNSRFPCVHGIAIHC